ncbi:treacle protein-like [Dermacentor albipictus]|uniref:treacle protein-like n=1 Tax=Dermacentor albipictus TaxID=60249 RepID=UPI0031FD6322
MKRSEPDVEKTAHASSSPAELDRRGKTPEPGAAPSAAIASRSPVKGPTQPERSPDDAGGSPPTSVEAAWALTSISRADEPRRRGYARRRFTSSSTSSPPSSRKAASTAREGSSGGSDNLKRRPSREKGRHFLDATTREAVESTATAGRGHHREGGHDESQSRTRLNELEARRKLSRVPAKHSEHRGLHRAPELQRPAREGVAANAHGEHRPRLAECPQTRASLFTGEPASVADRSSPQQDGPSRTRRRPSTSPSLARPPRDAKHRASCSATTLPTVLRGERKLDATGAMGDVTCYAAWKTRKGSTTTSSRSGKRSSSLQELSSAGTLAGGRAGGPGAQTSSRRRSSSPGGIGNLRSSRRRSEGAERSTASIPGSLEDRRRVPSNLGVGRQIEVFVDITKRHHATWAEPALATSSHTGSSQSFVEHISATVKIHPGKPPSPGGPPKPSDDSQLAEKREEYTDEEYRVDLERFMPQSKEALAYTELLDYPKHRPTAAPKAARKATSKTVVKKADSGPKVDLERFMPQSKEALAYTELLEYPKHGAEAAPGPLAEEEQPEPKVDLESFLPRSKEALSYTELLQYPKHRPKSARKPATSTIRWGTQGMRGVSPPSKTFSWIHPERGPGRPTSRRASLARPMGPAKRGTTPPPPPKAAGVAARPLRANVRDTTPNAVTKRSSKESLQRRASLAQSGTTTTKAGGAPRKPSKERAAPSKPVTPLPSPAPGGKRVVAVRPFVASFHAADELYEADESTDVACSRPAAPSITLSMPQTAMVIHGPKGRVLARPFYMSTQRKSSDEQPALKLPEKPPEEPSKKLPKKPPEKPPVKPPVPVAASVSRPQHRRLPKGQRPFKASVRDTALIADSVMARAKPLIIEKKVPTPMTKGAARAPAARPFAIGVQATSDGRRRRRVSSTRALTAPRGSVGAPSVPLPPAPPGMRTISMSTGHRDFREAMLWDYSPAPPPKTPQIHSKRASIAQAQPGAAPAGTSKGGTGIPSAVKSSTSHKPPSQLATLRRQSVPSTTAQAVPPEYQKADKKVAKTVSAPLLPATPVKSASADPESGVKAAQKRAEKGRKPSLPKTAIDPSKAPAAKVHGPASEFQKAIAVAPTQPSDVDEALVDYRFYKASVQVRESQQLPVKAPAATPSRKASILAKPKAPAPVAKPEEPRKETGHPLHVTDSRALVPWNEEKAALLPVEKPPAKPEQTKAPPMAPKEVPKPPPEEAKKAAPTKTPEPSSHSTREFRVAVLRTGKRKAHGGYRCAKHKDETLSQYERRKAMVRAKRKAKAKAKAKADVLIRVHEETSEIKPLRKKSKKKKHKCHAARKAGKEESESREKAKKKLKKEKSQSTTSDLQVKKKGKKKSSRDKSEQRGPPVQYVQTRTCSVIPCCFFLILALIVALLIAYFVWPILEVATTTNTSYSIPDAATVTLPPPYSKIYTCSSDICKAEGAYLKSLLSTDKNPCDNFYEYVCDGWSKVHPVPGTGAGGVQSMDTMLQDRLLANLEPLLLGMPDTDVRVAAELHGGCLRRDQVGNDGDTVVGVARQLFREWGIKEWPLLKPDAVTTSVAWTFAGELVRDLNVAALASVSVGVSTKVLETAAIELDKPRLLFSCNDASTPAVTDLFSSALKEIMTRFSAASGKNDIDEVMRVFIRIGSSPASAASPDTGPLSYTLLKLIDLDNGYKLFLQRVFTGIIVIDGTTEVMLKSTDYVRHHLTSAMQELPAHAVANYLGFVALAKMAPFFPEKLASLRQVFAKDVLDRTLPDVSRTKTLCLLAVQQLLPGCFAKAAANLRGMWHADLALVDWLSRMQSSFGRHHELVAWIDELSALIVRYRLKRNRMAAFRDASSEPCAPAPGEIPRRSEHPLRFFHQVSMLQEQRRLQAILKSGRDVLALRGEPRSELATVPEYEVMRQMVHVSMALFNTSVPANSTMFAFHLSRVAVRFYRALVQLLFPNIYERNAPIALGDGTRRQLERLLSCFEDDLRRLPVALRGPVPVDSRKTRAALLQHVAAVKLAVRAFDDHLNVRRIWQTDFRLQDLPDTSSDALFFIYYALDNCESADTVYAEHRGHWLPAHYRVNAALRHVDEFAHAFGCAPAADMAPRAVTCNVLKRR